MLVTILTRLLSEESAQDLAEYGIALAVITVGAGLAAIAISANVSTLWSKADSVIAAVI